MSDLFPGANLAPPINGSLQRSIREAAKSLHLQDTEPFVTKVVQLYEMVNCRHGLMLVGPPLAAKTSTYRVLAAALSQLAASPDASEDKQVETQLLNPKSLSLSELYGCFDPMSHEFTDGVLGGIFRQCVREGGTSRQWIIFDGPVDAEWIENMNTVLDDNKKLCLLNGEVIQLSDSMSLIFEADDLSQASPATVSRCGMVYLEPAMLGPASHLESWLIKLEAQLASRDGQPVDSAVLRRISGLFEAFFVPAFRFINTECTTSVPCQDI